MQKRNNKHTAVLFLLLLTGVLFNASALSAETPSSDEDINPKEIIFEHLQDAYWWHIVTINNHHVSVYLPVIVYSPKSGISVFSSSHIAHNHTHKGYYIASDGKYKDKIVTLNETGEEIRPLDLSLSKIPFAILFNSFVMLILFLLVARWYKKSPKHATPGGLVGAMEMFVMSVEDDIIRKSIGKDYARYSPYLLTAFFFIFISNIMGLIPFFPGGANVTGNIAVTLVLALCTMVAINMFGNKAYWKEIFWPEVPMWMKAPLPLMPVIELFGVISKPFALTIRLFANITAGHAVLLSITCLIFVTVKMGAAVNTSMTVFAMILSVFMSFMEILVAYIQAYVFTMLSSVFIGLSRHHNEH